VNKQSNVSINRKKSDGKRGLLFWAILGIILASPLSAQSENSEPGLLDTFAISIGFTGEWITHPGVFISAEISPLSKNGHQLVCALTGFWYVHPNNHTALSLQAEGGYRYTFPKGGYLETMLGAGYKKEWLHADGGVTIYEKTSDGTILEGENSGYSYFQPTLSLGGGWDMNPLLNIPVKIFSRLMIAGNYPYNNYFLPRFYIHGGMTYSF